MSEHKHKFVPIQITWSHDRDSEGPITELNCVYSACVCGAVKTASAFYVE